MIELDGDEERISSQGRYAERDIVQVRPRLSECPLSRMSGGMLGLVISEGTAADPSVDVAALVFFSLLPLHVVPLQPFSHFILIVFSLLTFYQNVPPRLLFPLQIALSRNLYTFAPLFIPFHFSSILSILSQLLLVTTALCRVAEASRYLGMNFPTIYQFSDQTTALKRKNVQARVNYVFSASQWAAWLC